MSAMTDARYPERWLNDRRLLRLSDAAWRLHSTALVWSVANRTDGLLWSDDLSLIPATDASKAAELEKAGLWLRDKDRWLIVEYEDTQTSALQLEHLAEARREKARKKKADQRARAKVATSTDPASPGDSPGDVPSTNTRTGQDRPGRSKGYPLRKQDQNQTLTDVAGARTHAPAREGGTDPVPAEDWPDVAIPGLDFPTTVVPGPRTNVVRHTADEDYCKSCGMTSPKHTRSCRVGKQAA